MIPKRLHRLLYRLAHRARHIWRRWRKTPIEGVTVIARDQENRLLLVRHSYGADVWSFVGGGINRGETPEQAAMRELREETGCIAHDIRLLGIVEETVSGCPHRAHVFACETRDQPCPDGRELVAARFFPLHSLPHPLSRFAGPRLALWMAETTKAGRSAP